MSDSEGSISSTSAIPRRAPAPPANFRILPSRDWQQAKAVLSDGPTLEEWQSWWNQTPWHLQHPAKKIQWTQKKKTSEVWQCFQPCAQSNTGKPYIRCTRCTSVLAHPALANSGTSALIRHLDTRACTKEARSQGYNSIKSFLQSENEVQTRQRIVDVGPWSEESFFTQTLRLVACLNLSFRALDNLELYRWVELIRKAPKSTGVQIIPSRKIRQHLGGHIEAGRGRVLQQLPQDAKIAIALDCWTSPNHLSFLAITGYFIDHSWTYQEVLLGFEHIKGQHSGQKLAQHVQEVLLTSNLSLERVITLTTDNAGNNRTMSTALESAQAIIGEDTQHEGIIRLPCLAHVIQLACKELLVGIKIHAQNDRIITVWDDNEERREQHTETVRDTGAPATLKKIRDTVIQINASTQRRDKFHQVQKHRPLNLVQDVSTRWNSTLKMILRARKLKQALAQYAYDYPEDNLPTFSTTEWRHIDYLIEILYPFHQYTNAVGKIRAGPSIHNVYAIYNRLFDHIEQYSSLLERKKLRWKIQIREALDKALAKLRKYYGETNTDIGNIYAIATILSPRWKLSIFESEAWQEEDTDWATHYLEVLREKFAEYQARRPHEELLVSSIPTSSPGPELSSQTSVLAEESTSSRRTLPTGLPRKLKRKGTDDLHTLLGGGKKAKRVQTASEIDRYLNDNDNLGIDFDDHSTNHTLQFWKRADNRKKYPVLAAMARDYLAIPAAGVGVERLFNTARDICTYRRYRLLPETIRQLMMTVCINRFDQRWDGHLNNEDRNENSDSDGDNHGDEVESDEDFEEEGDQVQGLISDDSDTSDTELESLINEQQEPELPTRAPVSKRSSRPKGLRGGSRGSGRLTSYILNSRTSDGLPSPRLIPQPRERL